VRRIASRDDERRDLRAQHVLGLRTRRGIAVEERAVHLRDESLVLAGVQLRVGLGEAPSFLITEAQARLSARREGFPSCATRETTPARPCCSTYAR